MLVLFLIPYSALTQIFVGWMPTQIRVIL